VNRNGLSPFDKARLKAGNKTKNETLVAVYSQRHIDRRLRLCFARQTKNNAQYQTAVRIRFALCLLAFRSSLLSRKHNSHPHVPFHRVPVLSDEENLKKSSTTPPPPPGIDFVFTKVFRRCVTNFARVFLSFSQNHKIQKYSTLSRKIKTFI